MCCSVYCVCSKYSPSPYSSVVEHSLRKRKVGGSNPPGGSAFALGLFTPAVFFVSSVSVVYRSSASSLATFCSFLHLLLPRTTHPVPASYCAVYFIALAPVAECVCGGCWHSLVSSSLPRFLLCAFRPGRGRCVCDSVCLFFHVIVWFWKTRPMQALIGACGR